MPSFEILDLLTASLATVGAVGFARVRIARQLDKNEPSRLIPSIFLALSLFISVFWGTGEVLANVGRDLGAALMMGAVYLFFENTSSPRWFLVGTSFLGASLFAPMITPYLSCQATHEEQATLTYLLELGPDDNISELEALLNAHNTTHERAFPTIDLSEDEDLAQYYILHIPVDQDLNGLLKALKADHENVDSIEPNVRVDAVPLIPGKNAPISMDSEVSDDPRIKEQWGFFLTHADQALERLHGQTLQQKATVAIVDTGVDSKHEELSSIFSESRGDYDNDGHGTHCAGIAAAVTNNGLGIASLNWNGEALKVTGYDAIPGGWGTAEDVAQGIIDAADGGADVISLSLGGYSPIPPKVEVDAIEYAIKKGAIIVVAAGNSSDEAKYYAPANIPGVIVVAAINSKQQRAGFSNTTSNLSRPIAAPGVDILSTTPGGKYDSWSGTSMATPMVAGLLGVMRSIDPEITADEAYLILQETGIQHDDEGNIGRIIDMNAAIKATLQR